jgi:N-acyl homoserine lactone hydrolase
MPTARLLAALLSLPLCAALAEGPAAAPEKPALKLYRLDCGAIRADDLNDFSDTLAYPGQSMRLVDSCYLIQHGNSFLLWDTGLGLEHLGKRLDGPDAKEEALSQTIADQLKKLGIAPERITEVGISHYHYDHTGQAFQYAWARLLLGKGDAAALREAKGERAKPLEHWLSGKGKLDEVEGDRDLYGDGTVILLNLAGHTPGHHGLLVRLPKTGPVILSGDAAHFRENFVPGGIPAWNTSRAESLASLERLRALIANTKATFVIQHDARDVEKLPAFPRAAE